ncbi:YihY/virulence factor BrkB family protein [Kitasatospora sp. NPDC048365]|uniref:YihY/virulence factor BrkB family protein n=1 Tax=Kitasatospora sp. NPDC048365 TaxID=3364050 RepID=UPI00372468E0
MGTATRVHGPGDALAADEAMATLREHGRWSLFRDAFLRFRYADGFSHARALAFQTVLALVPLAIALVGLSAELPTGRLGAVLETGLQRLVPAESADLVHGILERSRRRAGEGGAVALWFGAAFSFANLVTGLCQIERGANRIYGIERDRPFLRKYGRGVVMAAAAGLPLGLGFVVLVAGRQVGDAVAEVYGLGPGATAVWAVLHWPVGMLLAVMAASAIFRRAPRRRQPGYSWLAFGAAFYLVLWVASTWLLGAFLRLSGSFDALYGPLSVVFSLLAWSYLTAVALLLGIAFAAQLEADRSGRSDPVEPDPAAAGTGARA